MRQFLQRSLLPGWVGCVPQGTTARLACVERTPGRRPVVRWVAEEDWSQPGAALRRLRGSRRLGRRRIVTLLQRGHYQLVPLDAPEVPRDEWKQALRWQFKDLVSFPLEDAAVDVLEVPQRGPGRARVLAVAASQAEVQALAEPARAAGLPQKAVDVPETALRNISGLVEPAERAQAVLHLGTYGLLVITVAGELVQARGIELSAQQVALPEGDAVRQQAVERAGLELQRTLDSFERQHSQLHMARLLVVPTPGSAALCAFLRELLYAPVEELDLGEALDLGEVADLSERAAFGPWAMAIGAALRED